MDEIFLLLGSNIGDRIGNLSEAVRRLSRKEIFVQRQSAIYESEPWGNTDQPRFLNIVLQVKCDLSAGDLLRSLLQIENDMGRIRREKWSERNIDIDILYFGQKSVQTRDLKLPHPAIPQRRFTLMPLVELAPYFEHPILGKSQKVLLRDCKDRLSCIKTDLLLHS